MRGILRLLLAALLATSCGGQGPTSPSPDEPTSPPPSIPPYNRDEWRHWIDADGDCQDTRAEVLIRDSQVPVTFRPRPDGRPCVVDTGAWPDPYSGQTFTLAADLDVDHMVPLANAHRSGGWAWDANRKRDYANDLAFQGHLLPVSASLNRQKSDRGPEEWTPPNTAHFCDYGRNWQTIKSRWQLSMTATEVTAVMSLLARCAS